MELKKILLILAILFMAMPVFAKPEIDVVSMLPENEYNCSEGYFEDRPAIICEKIRVYDQITTQNRTLKDIAETRVIVTRTATKGYINRLKIACERGDLGLCKALKINFGINASPINNSIINQSEANTTIDDAVGGLNPEEIDEGFEERIGWEDDMYPQPAEFNLNYILGNPFLIIAIIGSGVVIFKGISKLFRLKGRTKPRKPPEEDYYY